MKDEENSTERIGEGGGGAGGLNSMERQGLLESAKLGREEL